MCIVVKIYFRCPCVCRCFRTIVEQRIAIKRRLHFIIFKPYYVIAHEVCPFVYLSVRRYHSLVRSLTSNLFHLGIFFFVSYM